MFELGVLGLARALEDGVFSTGWELHGVGSVHRGQRISLGRGASLELLPRSDQDAYASLMRAHDVGLALMYTPHPSLVPIEMASAGLLTVTNSFANKTGEALTRISSNLITAAPTVEGVATALCEAATGSTDLARRVSGSKVRWSRDWDESFPDELVEDVVATLHRTDVAAA
jgi:hypothetical protein